MRDRAADHGSPSERRNESTGSAPARLTLFVISTALVVLLYLFLLSATRGSSLSCIAAFMLAAGCLTVNCFFLRADKKSLSAIGFHRASKPGTKFLIGFFSGASLVAAWLLTIIFILGPEFGFKSIGDVASIANLTLFYLFNNAGEEFAYRGYAFLRLEDSYSRTFAILATSAVFALLHIQGGMAWLNAVAGVFTTALILGGLFSRSHSLPLSLGFHFATNVAQDVFSLRETPLSVLKLHYVEPVAQGRATATLLTVAALNLVTFAVLRRRSASGRYLRVAAHGENRRT